MLCLSIQQPWLDLILRGAKTMEIRNWATAARGRIALHAPIKIDHGAAYLFGYPSPGLLATGKILGVANIEEVVALDRDVLTASVERHLRVLPADRNIYGWELGQVRSLKAPIPLKGRPGLFPLPVPILEQLTTALAEG